MDNQSLRVAVIVPCHNEELTVGTVVADLRASVPHADIYVYDNNSTDLTSKVAAEAGAIVRTESRKGKGNVVRRAFADIDADVYLMIDGDDTYDASAAPLLIKTLVSGPLDHVVGVRVDTNEDGYRPGHELGNRIFNRMTSALFGEPVTDMFSGYRAFSRRYVKSFPANSEEFEIETELTIHAAALRVPQAEVPIGFKDRPEGSESKLRTFRDGFKILYLLGHLLLHERPLLGLRARRPGQRDARSRAGHPGGRRLPAHRRGRAVPDGVPGVLARRAGGAARRHRHGDERRAAGPARDAPAVLPPVLRRVRRAVSSSTRRYLVVGLFNTGLDVAIFTALAVGLDVVPVVANVVSTVVVMTVSFFLNRSWVFRAESAGVRAYAGFVTVTLFSGLLVQSLVILGVIAAAGAAVPDLSDDLVEPAAKVLAIGVGMVSNFLGYRYVFTGSATASAGRPDDVRSGAASSSTTTPNP